VADRDSNVRSASTFLVPSPTASGRSATVALRAQANENYQTLLKQWTVRGVALIDNIICMFLSLEGLVVIN
jgi:hypothetical protein